MMCWASDSLICAAIKVVLMRTYCKRLSISKKEHAHGGRVIVQRGGGKANADLNSGSRTESRSGVEGQISRQVINY
jgi:hypothetical protein